MFLLLKILYGCSAAIKCTLFLFLSPSSLPQSSHWFISFVFLLQKQIFLRDPEKEKKKNVLNERIFCAGFQCERFSASIKTGWKFVDSKWTDRIIKFYRRSTANFAHSTQPRPIYTLFDKLITIWMLLSPGFVYLKKSNKTDFLNGQRKNWNATRHGCATQTPFKMK